MDLPAHTSLYDPVADHPKTDSKKTIAAFKALVPSAKMKESVATLACGDVTGTARVKRATKTANQVQVWRGEPLVVHVPDDDPTNDRWFVVPVAWQVSYARKNATTANQHASHAFDCMMIRTDAIEPAHEVKPSDLEKAICDAIRASRDPALRFMLKSLARARSALADILIETFEEEFPDS